MPEEAWQDGEGGWVYQLAVGGGSAVPELSVLFGKGKFGLPNGMAWNLVSPRTGMHVFASLQLFACLSNLCGGRTAVQVGLHVTHPSTSDILQ